MWHTFWPQLVDCVNSQNIKSSGGGAGGTDELPSQGNKMLKQISAYCVFVWPQPERNDAHFNVAVKFLLKKDRPQVRQQLQSASYNHIICGAASLIDISGTCEGGSVSLSLSLSRFITTIYTFVTTFP